MPPTERVLHNIIASLLSMMAMEASNFVDNHKEYNDIFKVFSSGRREHEKVWVENYILSRLTAFFKSESFALKSEFKVLAVGSGIGSFDCMFINALFTHGKELIEGKCVSWTVVEVNPYAIDEFQQKVSTEDFMYRNISFSWVNKGVEEFFDVTEREHYDLVHFMHVLYYVNEEMVLRNVYEKFLASPGCILIGVGNEDNIWLDILKSLKGKIPSIEFKQPINVRLSEFTERNGWVWETYTGKVDFEISEIFNDGDPKGKALLKFFFHIHEDPMEKYGKELMSEITEFFRKMSWEKIKDGKRCFFVKEDTGILLIFKR